MAEEEEEEKDGWMEGRGEDKLTGMKGESPVDMFLTIYSSL